MDPINNSPELLERVHYWEALMEQNLANGGMSLVQLKVYVDQNRDFDKRRSGESQDDYTVRHHLVWNARRLLHTPTDWNRVGRLQDALKRMKAQCAQGDPAACRHADQIEIEETIEIFNGTR
jgi:hypothetical protein